MRYDRTVTGSVPPSVIDPICDMVVAVPDAQAAGRTVEHDGRTYAFCSDGCVKAFRSDPAKWAAKAELAVAMPTGRGPAVIDDGMRRWYESCRCCMHDAYPEIVATLDAERASSHGTVATAGICEVAEGSSAPS